MGFSDTGVAPGSTHRYRVAVTDPFGNIANSPWTTVTVASSGSDSSYVEAVQDSEPTHWWRFDETAGTTFADSAGFQPVTTTAGPTPGVPGAVAGDAGTAIRFPGTSTTRAYTTVQDSPPDVFTLEAWFRTTATTGGKIVGRGNRNDRNSSKADRQLYLDNAGHVLFGVKPNATRQVVTSPATYNDGRWHQAAASLSPAGMRLYVDGALVGQRSDVTVGEHLALGYWRIGGDTMTGWPSAPSNAFFNGDIDEVSVYYRALSAGEISTHYAAATNTPPPNQPPVADFGASVSGLTAQLTSQATDADGTIAQYAWTFGDGGTSTEQNPSHTYGSAGTYDVTLTVTDDDGATGTRTKQVTVTSGPTPFATDAFGRTVSNGWGAADTGGTWTRSGTASNFAVSGGVGTIRMGSPGSGPGMALSGVSSDSTDVRVRLGADKAATGGGTYLTVQPRLLANGDRYFTDVRLLAGGGVALTLGRAVAGTETSLQTLTVPGLTVAAGDLVRVRVQATGTSPTTVRAKVWADGATEPAGWTVSRTDSTAALQAPGAIGLRTYLSGSATNAPVLGLFDDLVAGPA
jgi:PKD repeat protein